MRQAAPVCLLLCPWVGLGGGSLGCLWEKEVGELKPGIQALSGLNPEQPPGVSPQW